MTCKAVIRKLGRLVLHDGGQDLIEYGLLMLLITIMAMTGVTALGTAINSVFWEFIAGGF